MNSELIEAFNKRAMYKYWLRWKMFMAVSEMYYNEGQEVFSWLALIYAECPDLVYFEIKAYLNKPDNWHD